MLAAQGVATHCAIMECLRHAMLPDTPVAVAIKQRANAVQLNRMFSSITHDLERRQTKPLPQRPKESPPPPVPGAPPTMPNNPPSGAPPLAEPANDAPAAEPLGADDPAGDAVIGGRRRPKRSRAKAAGSGAKDAPPEPGDPPMAGAPRLVDVPELPEDIETRPDGTPGSLAGYTPKPAVVQYIPREAPIMVALATRPGPWRMVNVAKDQAPPDPGEPPVTVTPPDALTAEPGQPSTRGPLDLRERIFTGDALARFASARFDPDAPVEPHRFDDEDSVVELELISTGGDPEAEAERAAMMAAHPEGKPIVTFRHGTRSPPEEPADPAAEETPPDP